MKRLALVLTFLIGGIVSAAAACTGPAVMHDFPGTAFNMALGQDPSGGCASNVNVLQNGALNATANPFYFLFGTGATLPAFASPPSVQGDGASGSALAGNPFRVGLSDGTNAQNWLAAIALADGVNGNNTGAMAPWLWNGTSYDRWYGDKTNGAWVNVKNANANGPAAPASASPVTPSNQPVGAATIATNQVSVATTAGGTQIVAARTGVAGTGRVSVTVCNTGTTAVYLGASGLTTSTGQYLAGIAGACATFNTTAAIYGIVGSGTETVAYSETY
jgi:hypothetical protein